MGFLDDAGEVSCRVRDEDVPAASLRLHPKGTP